MREHSFQLESLIRDETTGGVVTTDLDLFGQTLATVRLSDGSSKMLSLPNAGGSSVLSEVMSCELLGRCYGAKLLKTEMEVEYWPEGGSITDYTCQVFGHHVGVSVTRAMAYYDDFTRDHAYRLLTKKLKGVVQSSRNAVDRWTKQILHVWALSQHDADVTAHAYRHLDSDVTTNTVVLITVASNADEIFRNR